jgi:hypothetical protein
LREGGWGTVIFGELGCSGVALACACVRPGIVAAGTVPLVTLRLKKDR